MATGIDHIEHVVVVMMENRSFDNLLGWLYSPTDPPKHNIPEMQSFQDRPVMRCYPG